MGDYVQFWAHHCLARTMFHSLGVLFHQEFDHVDWEMVYDTLREVPRLFQVWACKQLMGINRRNNGVGQVCSKKLPKLHSGARYVRPRTLLLP